MSNNNPLKFQVDRLFERGLVERDQQFPDRDPAANKTSVDGQNADSLLKAASRKVVVTGSGEFHTYRQIRRKEMERIKSMDEEAVRHAEQLEFQRKRELIRQEEEERTAKNRAKRHKKKQKTVSKGAKREEQEVGQKEATTDMTVKDAGEEEAANNVHNGGVKSSPVNKLIAPLPVQLQPQYPDQLNTGRVFEQPLSAIKSTNLKIIDEEEDIL